MKKKSKIQTISVPMTVEISKTEIATLLVGAFEGGSNYWLGNDLHIQEPQKREMWLDADGIGEKKFWRLYDSPVSEGGYVCCSTSEDMPHPLPALNLATIERGLSVMARDYPRHFFDFREQSGDAVTSDVFLQCCLFGEVVFG